jgi:hypothetical protein
MERAEDHNPSVSFESTLPLQLGVAASRLPRPTIDSPLLPLRTPQELDCLNAMEQNERLPEP